MAEQKKKGGHKQNSAKRRARAGYVAENRRERNKAARAVRYMKRVMKKNAKLGKDAQGAIDHLARTTYGCQDKSREEMAQHIAEAIF